MIILDLREVEDAFIRKDEAFYIGIKLQMQQMNSFNLKTPTLDLLKKVTKKIFNITLSMDKTKKVVWDNSQMVKNMKYCTPPRFLIVEVLFLSQI